MKVALCVRSYDELSNLVHKNTETVEAKLVDREICEKEENGYQQIIPYVTIYAVQSEDAKLMMLQYQRLEKGEGEERLAGKTSIGFGGHIDDANEVVSREVITNEDGSTSFTMNLQDIIDTGYNCAVRELKEELDIDLQELDVNIYAGDTAFFQGDMSEEVNRVHLGFSIQIQVTPEKFEEIQQKLKFNPEEIKQVGAMGVNLDVIVEEMDLTVTINRITSDLRDNHGLEDWSCRIFNYVTRSVIHQLFRHVTYKDMIAIRNQKLQQDDDEVGSETQQEAQQEV